MPPMTLICAYEGYARQAYSRHCQTRATARRAMRSIERMSWIDGWRLP